MQSHVTEASGYTCGGLDASGQKKEVERVVCPVPPNRVRADSPEWRCVRAAQVRQGRQGRCEEVRAGGASAQGRPAEGAWVRPNGTSPHSQSSTGAKWGPCGRIKLYVSLRVRSASQRWGCVEGMFGKSCVVGCLGAGLGQSIGRPVGVACGCWVCP